MIGSAGTDAKVAWLNELGFDGAFNYKTPGLTVARALSELCPDGIDVYFDNVGGPTLEAALDACNRGARVVCCGQISAYDTPKAERYGVRNLFQVTAHQIRVEHLQVLLTILALACASPLVSTEERAISGRWSSSGSRSPASSSPIMPTSGPRRRPSLRRSTRRASCALARLYAGFEALPEAFVGLFDGANTGKAVVSV